MKKSLPVMNQKDHGGGGEFKKIASVYGIKILRA